MSGLDVIYAWTSCSVALVVKCICVYDQGCGYGMKMILQWMKHENVMSTMNPSLRLDF